MDDEIVWLTTERKFAMLAQRNAYFSIVYWHERGDTITLIVDNDEYELWEERSIEHESE